MRMKIADGRANYFIISNSFVCSRNSHGHVRCFYKGDFHPTLQIIGKLISRRMCEVVKNGNEFKLKEILKEEIGN